jgi:hypothetical protein
VDGVGVGVDAQKTTAVLAGFLWTTTELLRKCKAGAHKHSSLVEPFDLLAADRDPGPGNPQTSKIHPEAHIPHLLLHVYVNHH